MGLRGYAFANECSARQRGGDGYLDLGIRNHGWLGD